jgi:hypothetical protein
MNIDHTDLTLLGSSLNPAKISTGNVSDYEYIYIQGDSQSFTPTYGAYSWGNLVQNLLINLGSVLNSYGVSVDFLNASL